MVRHSTDRKKKFFPIFELLFCQKLGTYMIKKTPKNYRFWPSSLGATAISAKAVFLQNLHFPSFLASLCSKKCYQNFLISQKSTKTIEDQKVIGMPKYPTHVGKKCHMSGLDPRLS